MVATTYKTLTTSRVSIVVKDSRDHGIISSRLQRIVVTKEGEVGCECEH